MRLAAFSIAAALLLQAPASAASPDAAALLQLQRIDDRVAQVGHRLAVANADLCPRTQRLPGFSVHHLGQYAAQARPAAEAAFGLAVQPRVLTLAADGAAARAGLRVGDEIVAVAGVPVAPFFAVARKQSFNGVARFEAALEAALAAGPVTVAYRRDGQAAAARIEGDLGCVSRIQVTTSQKRRASADSVYVQVSHALVGFARDDDELALILAHEMAHNVLGHRAALADAGVPGGFLRALGVKGATVRKTEEEADYYGLYLMARAGFDPAKAPAFWRRFGNDAGLGLFAAPTHPSWGQRIRASELAAGEIAAKRQRGAPLVPEPRA